MENADRECMQSVAGTSVRSVRSVKSVGGLWPTDFTDCHRSDSCSICGDLGLIVYCGTFGAFDLNTNYHE